MAKRKAADGAGTIRQRPDGRWEARFTYTDELGQKRRRSIYGDSQKEVQKQLNAALNAVDDGRYQVRPKYTLKQWLEEWRETYGTDWKPRTADDYKSKADRHIIPALGDVQLTALSTIRIQRFINSLSAGTAKTTKKPLSAKSVKNLHGILHSCLKQAVASGLIATNPADNIRLPKATKADLSPLMDDDITRFVNACNSDRYGNLYLIDLFTGLRQSEILGLQWGDIDLEAGTIHVQRQLQKVRDKNEYILLPTKNGKDRIVPFAPSVAEVLKRVQRQQATWRIAAGEAWDNSMGLVFTNEVGGHLCHATVQKHFRKFRNSLGLKCRFHDLRHSTAIMALQSGCSVKSVSDMLGHYSSAFTMDVYADVSKAMQQDTQNRMETMFKAAVGG